MRNSKRTVFGLAAVVAVAIFFWSPVQSVGAAPEGPTKMVGVINDYVESGGAWHVNGEWSVHMKGGSEKADFFASLTMVRSDLWVISTGADPANTALRTPHTHHVGLIDGTVTALANGWRISGNAVITGNGNVAGFSPSPIVVEITGGNAVPAANVKLTFSDPAAGHFGTQPLDGVVVIGR